MKGYQNFESLGIAKYHPAHQNMKPHSGAHLLPSLTPMLHIHIQLSKTRLPIPIIDVRETN